MSNGIQQPTPPGATAQVGGRYLLADGQEHPCRSRHVSLDEVEIVAPVSGVIGERVTVYLDQLGAVMGLISSITSEGFRVAVDVTPERRARLAARLEWLAEHGQGRTDQRGAIRIVPTHTEAAVHLVDGSVVPGTIIDLSMSGAAIKAPVQPVVGEQVTLGKRRAIVVRHFETGFAVRFVLPFCNETFSPHVML
ncbi:pilus assembly protein PilZ [Methylobacterium terrae]|uniref:Pilus assembly protein PilZ n=1 Tax=Methylobacterium terrae TaxID=2202827 RepID=A0A2U8WW63_9HYPH|nr:PilZ domain-containing protein [Methylobacterium terrae]AWN49576.1 pilus assembly protein PilZ [Methylobacterium terrae]